MKRIYFDQNIWFDFMYSRNDTNLDVFLNELNRSEFEVVYSPATCEEICNSFISESIGEKIKEDEMLDRIAKISLISENKSIIPFFRSDVKILSNPYGTNSVFFVVEDPKDNFKRVYDYYASNKFSELGQQEVIDAGRELEIDANLDQKLLAEINNSDPVSRIFNSPECLLNIKKELASSFMFGDAMRLLIKNGTIIHPMEESDLSKIADFANKEMNYLEYLSKAKKLIDMKSDLFSFIKNDFPCVESVIDVLMKELIKNRYASEKNKMSSLHDTTHVIYSSFCDYFVTNDKKLYKKAKAIYEFIGVKTEVIYVKNDKDWYTKFFK
ncbi:hypothetical protein [Pectobacterium carotovorum]|uniref:hypothetical protein n=1 Tax=Pectobacterium carotovorum TaxID=554 RepID=UPI0015DF6AC5|nr:hypothetical protein [Pectobacterium carotovorum]MBA0175095.1 hypothetical protein [Pectobacterium carotovorum]